MDITDTKAGITRDARQEFHIKNLPTLAPVGRFRLEDDGDQTARPFIDDPFQGVLEFVAGIFRHER